MVDIASAIDVLLKGGSGREVLQANVEDDVDSRGLLVAPVDVGVWGGVITVEFAAKATV